MLFYKIVYSYTKLILNILVKINYKFFFLAKISNYLLFILTIIMFLNKNKFINISI